MIYVDFCRAALTRGRAAWYKGGMLALSSTLGVFGLILLLARLKVPLAVAILTGAAAEGLLLGLGPAEMLAAAGAGAIRPATVSLIVVTVLLLALSQTMRAGGQLERIVDLARRLLRRPAVAMSVLPALIGLLPMPGGALFSAPMVESAAGKDARDRGMLSAVNYWFRHIWEHWWPLYPGVILAMELTGSGLGTFIAFQMPLGLFMILGGLWIFRGSHPSLHVVADPPPPRTARRLLWATSTIWVILLVWGASTAAVHFLPGRALPLPEAHRRDLQRYLPVLGGLLVSLAWTVRLNRLAGRQVARIFASKSIYQLALLVLSVKVFQAVLARVGAAEKMGRELQQLHVPMELVVAALPFIAGMVTGLAIGFVGTSFPIVLGMLSALPEGSSHRPYIALAYAFGHLGQMMSPLHLCHVVSNRYFNTGFARVYRYILPSAILTAALAAGYFVVLRCVLD